MRPTCSLDIQYFPSPVHSAYPNSVGKKKNVDILMQVPLAFGSVYCFEMIRKGSQHSLDRRSRTAQKYVKGLQELKITMMTVICENRLVTDPWVCCDNFHVLRTGYIKMITTKTQISLCRAKTRL